MGSGEEAVDDNWSQVKAHGAGVGEALRHRRNNGTDGHGIDRATWLSDRFDELAENKPQFIGGAWRVGCEPPLRAYHISVE